MAASLPAETFWDQTPRTHAAIMTGRQRAVQSQMERDVALAWQIEVFGREKRLKALPVYLAKMKPRKAQSGAEVLAIFQGFAAAGVPVTIRKVDERLE